MVCLPIRWKQLLIAVPLAVAMLVTTTFRVYAHPIYYGDEVPAGTVIQSDVFLTGNNITIDGTVVGDVFALGNHIHINGTVEGSLVAVAQTIRINGKVNGTTYAASIAFELGASSALDRNLYYGGLSFATRKDTLINRDLAAFSLGGTMAGQINGNVNAVIGPYEILKLIFDAFKVNVQLPGMIYDEPELPEATPENLPSEQPTLAPTFLPTSSSGSSSSTLTGFTLTNLQLITPTATSRAILPTLTTNPQKQITVSAPVIMPTSKSPVVGSATQTGLMLDWEMVADWCLGRLRSLLVLSVFCLIAYWSMPEIISRAAGMLRDKPLLSLGTGLIGTLVSFNAILAAILVAAIFTAIGFWLVFATVWELGIFIWVLGLCLVILFIMMVCFLVFYTTKTIIALLISNLIFKKVNLKTAYARALALFLGLVIYVILAGLPYIGWVISLLATGFGFGAAWLNYRYQRKKDQESLTPSRPNKIKPLSRAVKKAAPNKRKATRPV
jgi:cytoskeletal protein CcmA (bactofilin family)